MSNAPIVKKRALDSNGDPISGAKLYIYEAGTTTPLATYSDFARTSANANPVIADGDGWFGEIHFSPLIQFREILKDASDNTIYDIDDLYANQQSEDLTDPSAYGAVGDNVTDDTAAMQLAIDGTERVVDLRGKTYRIDSQLVLTSDIEIVNGTINLSLGGASAGGHIVGDGTLGADESTNSSHSIGDKSVTLDATPTMVAGEYVRLYDSSASEYMLVESVAGNVVTFHERMRSSYGSSTNLKRMQTIKNVTFRDVAITGGASNDDAIAMTTAENIRFINCRFSGLQNDAVTASDTIDLKFDGCTFTAVAQTGFDGISVTGGKRLRVENSSIRGVDHGVRLLSRSTWDSVIDGCEFSDINTAMFRDATNGGRHTTITNCEFINYGATGTYAINSECTSGLVIDNCRFGGQRVYLDPRDAALPQDAWARVTNCDFEMNTTSGAINLDYEQYEGGEETGEGFLIAGNSFRSSSTASEWFGVSVTASTGSADARRLRIRDNSFKNCGISITAAAGTVIADILIAENYLSDGGITVTDSDAGAGSNLSRVKIKDNSLFFTTYGNITCTGPELVHVTDNVLKSGLILIDGAGNTRRGAVVRGNQCPGATTGQNIAVQDYSDVIVDGNYVESPTDDCIFLGHGSGGNLTGFVVSNNLMKSTPAAGSSIQVTASGANIAGVTITGNSSHDDVGAADGIGLTTVSTAVLSDVAVNGNNLANFVAQGGGAAGINRLTLSGNVVRYTSGVSNTASITNDDNSINDGNVVQIGSVGYVSGFTTDGDLEQAP